MKKSTITNYILVDFGNTCVKTCIYNKKSNKLSKFNICDNDTKFSTIFKKLKAKSHYKVIFIGSPSVKKQISYLIQIREICTNVKVVTGVDFKHLVDLSNISKNVTIGNDILLATYYMSIKHRNCALLSLGTVYYLIVTRNKQMINCNLIPSLGVGLEEISKKTSIPSSLIPKYFNKTVGMNTKDAFSAGIRNVLDGYLDLICKKYHLKPKQIIITGGQANKFASLNKKYKFVSYLPLKALAELLKQKRW